MKQVAQVAAVLGKVSFHSSSTCCTLRPSKTIATSAALLSTSLACSCCPLLRRRLVSSRPVSMASLRRRERRKAHREGLWPVEMEAMSGLGLLPSAELYTEAGPLHEKCLGGTTQELRSGSGHRLKTA